MVRPMVQAVPTVWGVIIHQPAAIQSRYPTPIQLVDLQLIRLGETTSNEMMVSPDQRPLHVRESFLLSAEIGK